METINFIVTAEEGFHTRICSLLAEEASKFKEAIFLEFREKKVNLKSIMGVLSLSLCKGDEFRLVIENNQNLREHFISFMEKSYVAKLSI